MFDAYSKCLFTETATWSLMSNDCRRFVSYGFIGASTTYHQCQYKQHKL